MERGIGRRRLLTLTSAALGGAWAQVAGCARSEPAPGLWRVWDQAFARARFVSLSHVLTEGSPQWKGFPPSTDFDRGKGRLDDLSPFTALTYETTGFETTAYALASDQFGTQLDPPAHWHPCFPAIDELPPTLALRKLAVISIATQVASNPAYALTADDVRTWESAHGVIQIGRAHV